MLHFGPYNPPKVRRRGRLFDEVHGTVVVGRFSDAEILWPKRWGRNSLVLCGDLTRAVRRESAIAISHWWGVSRAVVGRWRRALGVGKYTEGTSILHSKKAKELFSSEKWAEYRLLACDPVFRTKLSRSRRRQKIPPAKGRHWTSQEEALLGTMTDRTLAERLQCPTHVVLSRRQTLGIAPFGRRSPQKNKVAVSPGKLLARRLILRLSQRAIAKRAGLPSYGLLERTVHRYAPMATVRRLAAALECQPEDILLRSAPVSRTVPDDSLLGTMMDKTLARRWKLPCDTVRLRRIELGIPSFQSQARSIPDTSLLGTQPDKRLAAMWGLSAALVRHRRQELGIPNHSRRPLPDESLLGTRPDRELAALWGTHVGKIVLRRSELGIPTFGQRRRLLVVPGQLLARREQAGLTQQQVAASAGLSSSYFSDAERNKKKTIPRATAERFAAALGCSVEDFTRPLLAEDGLSRVEQENSERKATHYQ